MSNPLNCLNLFLEIRLLNTVPFKRRSLLQCDELEACDRFPLINSMQGISIHSQ